MPIHLVFDLLSAVLSFGVTALCYQWRLKPQAARIEALGTPYALTLVLGATLGGYGFGTLNLALSGAPGIGRSILGALVGAVAAIEIFKKARAIKGSTGVLFVPAFATSVTVGRIGCYLSGLADNTYGTPTTLPWGHDFGDGILRHPVPLYESLSMGLFLAVSLVALYRRSPLFLAKGFYLLTATYAAQRFAWEFFKPYAPVVGPLNIFHLLCIALFGYSALMFRKAPNV